MLTLTCRATGGPITVNPLRLSSIAPVVIPDQTGSIIVTIDAERLVVAESTSEIAAMLQPAPEPAAAPEPDAVELAAELLFRMADALPRSVSGLYDAIDSCLGLPPGANEARTAEALLALADRLEKR